MRLFVAVLLPEDVRERLATVQERLRRAGADVSWVRPGNLHITLKFLGDTDARRVERVRGALAEAVPRVPAFSAELAGLGTFGGRTPRVVWAGVRGGAEPLAGLAGAVDEALAGAGVPREGRRFAAHFTLGRVRSARNLRELEAALRAEPTDGFGQARVDEVCLMESQLHPGGSIYTVRDRYLLRRD